MRKHRRLLAALLALVLPLALGVGATVLRPTLSEAEIALSQTHEGMWQTQVEEVVGLTPYCFWGERGTPNWTTKWRFPDGSGFTLVFEQGGVVLPVSEVHPPDAVHPLIRLRRTLARIFPALKE